MATFQFETKNVSFKPGQSIAGALFQSGIYDVSYSKQTKSERGAFCMNGDCCGCYVKVDGHQVLACRTPASEALHVKRGGIGEI